MRAPSPGSGLRPRTPAITAAASSGEAKPPSGAAKACDKDCTPATSVRGTVSTSTSPATSSG